MPVADGPLPAEVINAVAADPDIRSAAKRLVLRLMQDIEYTMEYGSEAARTTLAKSVIPGILRSMQSAEKDAHDREADAALQSVRDAFAAAVGGVGRDGDT